MSYDLNFDNSNTVLGFPSEFMSDEEKATKDYGLQYFKAMWNVVNYGGAFNERRARLFKLRKWAEGLQDIDDLKQQMGITQTEAGEQETALNNIDFKPISVIPKFVDSMVGLIINQQFKIQCDAIDSVSKTKKDAEKAKLEADILFKKFSDRLKQKVGVEIMDKEYAENMMQSQEEIDLYMDLTFKLATEIAMELGIEYVLYNNDFEEIKQGILKDLFVLKIAATFCSYGRNGKIQVERVLPEWMITPFSNRNDFKNIPFGGYVKLMRVQDIKLEAGDQFNEKEYFQIAQMAATRYGNPKWDARFSYYPKSGATNLWYNFLVPVLVGEFLSNTYKGYESFTNKDGVKRLTKSIKKKDGVSQYYLDIANKYEGRWIVGTEYIYNYGKAQMVRERINGSYSLDTPLGLTIYMPDNFDMENKSHVERMIHSTQQMQLAEAKIQLIMAKARPMGYAMNVKGMQAVDVGLGDNKKLSPLKLQSIFDQTGVLYYNSEFEDGTPNNNPIMPMPNGIDFNGIQAAIAVYNMHFDMLRDLTGINNVVDASSPSSESLVGVNKIAANATLNTLRPIKNAYINIIERTAKYIALMIQDVCAYGDGIEGMIPAMGERGAQVIKLGADVSLPDFGIKIEALPTDEQNAVLDADIQFAIQNKLIKPSDGVFCRSINNLKQKRAYLAKAEQKYAKEQMAAAQANAKASAESNAMAGQAVEAAKAETEKIKGMREAEILTIKKDIKKQEDDEQLDRDLKKMKVQHQYTMEEISESNKGGDKTNQKTDLIK